MDCGDKFNIDIMTCAFVGIDVDWDTVYALGNEDGNVTSACYGSENGNYTSFSFAYSECGTVAESNDTHLTVSTILHGKSYEPVNEWINRDVDHEFEFSCTTEMDGFIISLGGSDMALTSSTTSVDFGDHDLDLALTMAQYERF